MISEAEATRALLNRLKVRGFKVIKHSDTFTKGIPDFSASRDGLTTWVEAKLVKWYAETPIEFNWRRVLLKRDMVQLATMCELEEKSRAVYVLFFAMPHSHEMTLCSPALVLHSYRENVAVGLAISSPETFLEE